MICKENNMKKTEILSCNPCNHYTSNVWTPPWRNCNHCPICQPPCQPFPPQPFPPISQPPWQPMPPWQPSQPWQPTLPCPKPPPPPPRPQENCDDVMWLLIGYWLGNKNCRYR